MLLVMRIGSQSRLLVMWALPLALWAALPAVRWCPPGWKQACAAALMRCSAMQPPAACRGVADGCPLASDAKAAGNSAVAHDACPIGAACPMAPAPPRAAPARGEPFPIGGAFCVGDPNGGAGLRAEAPRVQPVTHLLAVLPDLQLDRRAVPQAAAVPQLSSRPPPRAWRRRPPARAPPSLRQT
jgi:hypothetical protein